MTKSDMERATEIEWLKFFAQRVDVHKSMRINVQAQFQEETGKRPPRGWDYCIECQRFIADGLCVCEDGPS